jgi:hypothetical protein
VGFVGLWRQGRRWCGFGGSERERERGFGFSSGVRARERATSPLARIPSESRILAPMFVEGSSSGSELAARVFAATRRDSAPFTAERSSFSWTPGPRGGNNRASGKVGMLRESNLPSFSGSQTSASWLCHRVGVECSPRESHNLKNSGCWLRAISFRPRTVSHCAPRCERGPA